MNRGRIPAWRRPQENPGLVEFRPPAGPGFCGPHSGRPPAGPEFIRPRGRNFATPGIPLRPTSGRAGIDSGPGPEFCNSRNLAPAGLRPGRNPFRPGRNSFRPRGRNFATPGIPLRPASGRAGIHSGPEAGIRASPGFHSGRPPAGPESIPAWGPEFVRPRNFRPASGRAGGRNSPGRNLRAGGRNLRPTLRAPPPPAFCEIAEMTHNP